MPRQWKSVLTSIPRVSMDLKLQLMQPQIIFRMYWIPLYLYKKELSRAAFCWICNNNASLKHMLFQCPIIWEKAVDYINVTVRQKLKFSEDNILLNYIPWYMQFDNCTM